MNLPLIQCLIVFPKVITPYNVKNSVFHSTPPGNHASKALRSFEITAYYGIERCQII